MKVKDALKNFNLPVNHIYINDSTLHGKQSKHFDFDFPPDTFAYKEWLENYGDSELIYLFYNPIEEYTLIVTI